MIRGASGKATAKNRGGRPESSFAAREALQSLCPNTPVQLKWPNDLLIDRQKLAGLLCERIDNLDFIGVGVNVNVGGRFGSTSSALVDARPAWEVSVGA